MAFLIFRVKTGGSIIKESFKENLLGCFRMLRMISIETVMPIQSTDFSCDGW